MVPIARHWTNAQPLSSTPVADHSCCERHENQFLGEFRCSSSSKPNRYRSFFYLEHIISIYISYIFIVYLMYVCMYGWMYVCMCIIEGSLEVKLPTIWTDEKQSREEAERRDRLEERRVEEKE